MGGAPTGRGGRTGDGPRGLSRTGAGLVRGLVEASLTCLLSLAIVGLLFTNGMRMLEELGRVWLFWLPMLVVLAILARGPLAGPGLAGRGLVLGLATFAASAVAAGLVGGAPGRLARHLAQLGIVWLPLLALVSAPRLVRRWRDLLALGLAIAACLAALALAGPLLMRRLVVPLYSLDVDHRPRPNKGGANEDGVYSRLTSREFRKDDFNVVCLGDSFTANPHLPEAERWPSLLEHRLQARSPARRVRVANFGWVSSSPVLQARQLRAIGAKYKPGLIVQGFDMTDFHDDLVARRKLERMGADGAEVSIFRAFGVGASLALGVDDYGAWLRERLRWAGSEPASSVPGPRYFFLFEPAGVSEPYFSTSWEAIRETERVARAMGARYALFVFPRYQQYDPREAPRDPERRVFPADAPGLLVPLAYFEGQARTVSFPVHSLRESFLADPAFPKCRDNDPHWNAEGNRVAAEAIDRCLVADRLAPPLP
ncbi:MAG: hypothetical protein DMF81_06710 [Acidobacteria bacterium]|nr:MAG: hypothetical protein DMF81_06710 [Acidobacteriota bacterium]